MGYVQELAEVAKKHGLVFIDARDQLKDKLAHIKMSDVKNIVAHSYGVKRQQSSAAILGYISQGNPYAHIYINTGNFKYLLLVADINERAVHVGYRNVDTVGIEMNEIGGSSGYQISDDTVSVFDEVSEVIRSHYKRSLPIISHRQISGKDCPHGYYEFAEFTKKLCLGVYREAK